MRCYQSDGFQPGVTERADERPRCEQPGSYCNAMRVLDEIEVEHEEHDGRRFRKGYAAADFPWDAFPTVCESCGREMNSPERQIFLDEIYVARTGPLAGQEWVRRELPVGAMWNIDWYSDIPDWCGADGLAVMVVVPGGEWHVDSRANNCTKPDDKRHRCWVRHGDPRTGYLHVDKDGTAEQPTCDAGAGSIWMNAPNGWHGFLYRGYLIDCDQKGMVDQMIEARHPNPVPPAERSLKVHQFDRMVARPTPIPTPAASGPRHMRSNRGFQVRRK